MTRWLGCVTAAAGVVIVCEVGIGIGLFVIAAAVAIVSAGLLASPD
jgi:hypothetical protein